MKKILVPLVAVLAFVAIQIAGCSQAAPTPTSAPAAPKAAEPTKAAAPAAQPTAAASANKVNYPEKGKAITMIVIFPAGGNSDIAIRILSPILEKELGVPVEVVNKAGAGGQVGLTELYRSKPDGYTLGLMTLPATINFYLEPGRQAPFLKEIIPLGLQYCDPFVIAVPKDSPYKDMKDLVDAMKANPGKIKGSAGGILSPADLTCKLLKKAADVNFSVVNFDGAAPAITAMLGGHVDFAVQNIGSFVPQLKSGEVRMLGVADKNESPFLPGVKTMEAQGYNVHMSSSGGIAVPPKTPVEIQKVLEAALQKAINSDEHKKKAEENYMTVRYMNQAELMSYWQEMEAEVKPMIEEISKEEKK